MLAITTAFALPGPGGSMDDLSGTYRIAELPAVRAAQSTAVEDAASQVPWGLRVFARPRIRDRVWNCGTMTLELRGEALHFTCDHHPPTTFPLTPGTHRWTGTEGVSYDLTAERTDDALVLRFAGESGTLQWTWRCAEGLSVETELSSPWFPDPVHWAARYVRAPPAR